MKTKILCNCFICQEPIFKGIVRTIQDEEKEFILKDIDGLEVEVELEEKEKKTTVRGIPGFVHKKCKLDFFKTINNTSTNFVDLTEEIKNL